MKISLSVELGLIDTGLSFVSSVIIKIHKKITHTGSTVRVITLTGWFNSVESNLDDRDSEIESVRFILA